jgi:predicted RNase H-like nuclease (RuvC/YqgF family)
MEIMIIDKPDLVAQLRDTSRVLETRGNTCDAMRCEAAADEIARLRADVERHESYGGELEGRLADRSEEVERLRAEVTRLTRERAAIGSDHHDAISAIRLENYTLRAEVGRAERERDAWSDEAVKMLRQRNVLLEWARVRAGLACGHDVMVAAGLAAAPAGDKGGGE